MARIYPKSSKGRKGGAFLPSYLQRLENEAETLGLEDFATQLKELNLFHRSPQSWRLDEAKKVFRAAIIARVTAKQKVIEKDEEGGFEMTKKEKEEMDMIFHVGG